MMQMTMMMQTWTKSRLCLNCWITIRHVCADSALCALIAFDLLDLTLDACISQVTSGAVVDTVLKRMAMSNCLSLYGLGCLYNEQLREKALTFIIEHAIAVLDPDFPYLSQIGALRDCDVHDLLTSEIMVPDEYSVYKFLKSWKIYRDNPRPSDETLQKLMQSCVRWACMSDAQIRAIAGEGLVNTGDWLLPYLLTPHTQPPRSQTLNQHSVGLHTATLRHQSTCHQVYHVKIPVTALDHCACLLMFKQFRIHFVSSVIGDQLQFVTSWKLSANMEHDHDTELIYIASEVSLIRTGELVNSGTRELVNCSSVVSIDCKKYKTLALPMSLLSVDALVTDKNFLHGDNLDCLICRLVIIVRPCNVSFFDVAGSRLFITDLELPPHFLVSGYDFCVHALSRDWRVLYNPVSAELSVNVVPDETDRQTDRVYRIRVICIKGSTSINAIGDAMTRGYRVTDHVSGIWFVFTPPIIDGTSIEWFNNRPWGILLRLTIVCESS